MWFTFLIFCYGLYGVSGRDFSGGTGKRLSSINWMHVPKASSWLGDFIFMYACPHMRPEFDASGQEEFFYELVKDNATHVSKCDVKILPGRDGSFGWHDPYIPSISNGSTVALFRGPRNRLISAFLFENGMMIPPGHLYSLNETHQKEIFKNLSATPFPIISYSQLIGIPSCQTKMVLGHYCGTEVPISPVDLEEAKRRVEFDFAFVGLTEESEASAKLFYAMHGDGKSQAHSQPHTKHYRANTKHPKTTHSKLVQVLKEQNWSDPPEQALYQHVRKVFYRRCTQYNITTVENFKIEYTQKGRF